MKKRIFSVLCAVVLILALVTGCGGSVATKDAMSMTGAAVSPSAPSLTPNYKVETSYDSALDMEYVKGEVINGSAASGSVQETPKAEQKIIYTAYLEMESTAFDDTVAALTELTRTCGGYFSSSNVRNYQSGYRSASYVIRVPAERYEDFLAQAGELCHVLRRNSTADDISDEYYDIDGRLTTQKTKLARLQELLKQAKNMEDIITIESAISDTEMQIEYLSGTLKRYDALVDYSTVDIQLQEVYRLSNTEEPVKGFGSRFITALKSGWENFVDDTEDFLVDLAYSWMWVLIWIVIIFVAVRVIRRRRKSGKCCKLFRRRAEVPSGDGHLEEK